MNYNEALDYIHSLGKFSLPAGLERIKKALDILDNPQNKFKSIHIAGTNGKGSVSAMISSVFKEAGYKTGLFISPFIIDFRERIQTNGNYISESMLINYTEKVIATNIKLNEFEFITVLAFLFFADEKCDIVICETGLGGRFDATNVLENKAVSVITKIGFDHTDILGDTIEKITFEKCGILRDCPTVSNPCQNQKALDVIERSSKSLTLPDLNKLEVLSKEEFGNKFIYKGNEYQLSLCGDFQVENAITAIETINVSGFNIPYTYIYRGLLKARFPARMEVVSKNPLIILDGAHNSDGAKVLSQEIRKFSGNVIAIIGMMEDKDCDNFLRITLKYCKLAITVEVENNPRSMSAKDLKSMASKYCNCFTAEDYRSALIKARSLSEFGPIFVFGSLYLASDIRKILVD